MSKNYTYDMTTGNPIKLLLSFAIPMLIGNVFQQFYNMVDAMIVGNYVGANALGAVGATGPIIFLFFSLTIGLSAGIGIIVSQFFGAKDEVQVRKSVATCMYVMFASSLLMGGIGLLTARPIMIFLSTPQEILEDAVLYMQMCCLGFIAVGAFNGVASILRGVGDSKTPLYFLVVGCLLNIVLDLVFVINLRWGVFGVAFATIISEILAGVCCALYAWIKVPIFRMPLKEFVPDKDLVKKSLYLGIPVALQNSMIAVSCIVLQKVVNGFGTTIVAAFTAENRFEQLIQQPFNSLGAAIATYTGQNMGAGQKHRVKEGFWAGTFISCAFSLLMLPVAWFGGEAIMRLFTNEAAVIYEGARGIKIVSLFYASLGMIYVTRNVLNGSGDVNFAMVSGFIEVGGRVGFAKPLTYIPAIGMLSIWYTTGLTWVLTAAISCIRYAQGKWKLKAIVPQEQTNDKVKELSQ